MKCIKHSDVYRSVEKVPKRTKVFETSRNISNFHMKINQTLQKVFETLQNVQI